MTVQAGIETDLSLELLVGDMPEVPCEHSQHGDTTKRHSDEPASHYLKCLCDCAPGLVFAACPEFVKFVASNAKVRCSSCKATGLIGDLLHILAPIKK